MITPLRQSSISILVPEMQAKVNNFLAKAKASGFNIQVFESLRTRERQAYLYGQGRTPAQCKAAGLKLFDQWANPNGKIVTWTMTSQHLLGKAVDIVFVDAHGNPSWSGDWKKVIAIGKACGLTSLSPVESCHFQIS
jgi:D-alanyl-D-alanine dipeptidase